LSQWWISRLNSQSLAGHLNCPWESIEMAIGTSSHAFEQGFTRHCQGMGKSADVIGTVLRQADVLGFPVA
jgi:hypothetical protein